MITWEIFKWAFLDSFFPRELRESKVEVFINFRQGGMNVLDYSLMISKFSKYTPSLVSNQGDEMSHLLTGVSDDLVEKCGSAMLDDNMNISCLMFRAQQVEESRLRRKNTEDKIPKYFESGSSKGRLEIEDTPRFK